MTLSKQSKFLTPSAIFVLRVIGDTLRLTILPINLGKTVVSLMLQTFTLLTNNLGFYCLLPSKRLRFLSALK